jgi:pilus assembly protein Flp/PilA
MFKFMQDFSRSEGGTTAIEYALIASLIAVAIVSAVQSLGTSIVSTFYDKIVVAL